jgi:hypothetical protein
MNNTAWFTVRKESKITLISVKILFRLAVENFEKKEFERLS